MSALSDFRRSGRHLAVRHLFYGVDCILITEGCPDAGENAAIADQAFWRTTFGSIRPDLKVTTMSVGSRRVVEELWQEAGSTAHETIHFCHDADFDYITGRQQRPGMLRSVGYSWESDLVRPDVLECVIRQLRLRCAETDADCAAMANWLRDFVFDVGDHVHVDAEYVLGGSSGIFDRENFLSGLKRRSDHPPAVDHATLLMRQQIAAAEARPRMLVDKSVVVPARDMCGAHLLRAAFHGVCHFVSRHGGKITLKFETFTALAISCFERVLSQLESLRARYASQLT